jgi:hypothetical protein
MSKALIRVLGLVNLMIGTFFVLRDMGAISMGLWEETMLAHLVDGQIVTGKAELFAMIIVWLAPLITGAIMVFVPLGERVTPHQRHHRDAPGS